MLWRKKPDRQLVWCEGCSTQWPACAMSWTETSLYRCRLCNPPCPPHAAQLPAAHARSIRYQHAYHYIRGRSCTECGHRYGNHFWEASWRNPLRGTQLCQHCIGPERDNFDLWYGMEMVRF